MIDAKELRIGNLMDMRYPSGIFKPLDVNIYVLDSISVGTANESNIAPIVISESWMLSFGFCKNKELRYEIYLDHDRWLVFWGRNSFLLRGDNDFGVFVYDIKYVHQLQNLFYALTGKELELNKAD